MGMTLRQRRAMLAIIVGVIGFIGGIAFQAQVAPGGKYETFLILISYWIAPWLAVVFVDYWLRKGNYGDESMFYNTSYNRWQGIVAMAAGLVISVYLFANVFPLYVGPIPTNNPGIGDVTFIVGFVLTAVLYYVFNLGLRNQAPSATPVIESRN
jgi:NCS1 family nucleobase:cation symporter-1